MEINIYLLLLITFHQTYSSDKFSEDVFHSRENLYPEQLETSSESEEEIIILKACPELYGECRTLSQCAPYLSKQKDKTRYCELNFDNGEKGIGYCCLTERARIHKDTLVKQTRKPKFRMSIALEDIDASLQDANNKIESYLEVDKKLSRNSSCVLNRPAYAHGFLKNEKEKEQILKMGLDALEMGETVKSLRARTGLPINAEVTIPEGRAHYMDKCSPIPVTCTKYPLKYRTYDGTCNNPIHPWDGAAKTPQLRILPAVYVDGVHEPRLTYNGKRLPSATKISSALSGTGENSPHDLFYTAIVASFGQFVDHDFALTNTFTFKDGKAIQCCEEDKSKPLPKKLQHPQCFPIEVPEDDPYFSEHGVRCMNLVRSIPVINKDCNVGTALNQINSQTAWLDLSLVYGIDSTEANSLRGPRGTLRTTPNRPKSCQLLPVNPDPSVCVKRRKYENSEYCFIAGDSRVNQNPVLIMHHTMWLREHNRVAEGLGKMHPTWTSCEIFQETRRITMAKYQHILYNEFIPLLIGKKYSKHLGILPLDYGHSKCYDENLRGSMTNEFNVAAYRLHTLTRGIMQYIDCKGRKELLRLSDSFDTPAAVDWCRYAGDEVIRGEVARAMGAFDGKFTEELTHYMFRLLDIPGHDIFSLNIQRGRDHGVDRYVEYRKIIGLRTFRDFTDAIGFWRNETIDTVKELYSNLMENVDLYVGGIVEKPVDDAVVGETFRAILGDQFFRLKCADRYFYDIGGQPHSFTEDQLNEIRKTSFSRIICDNTETISKMQPLAFVKTNRDTNPVVSCDSNLIPKFSLKPWAIEKPGKFDCQDVEVEEY